MMAHASTEPWELVDLDNGRDRELNALVNRTVAKLSVEFLHTNGTKPHVVFNLKANATVQDPNPTFKGVKLSMEYLQIDEVDTGTFQITPLPYSDSSRSARGAFDFPLLRTNLTVKDWIQIIRGRLRGLPVQHTADLTRFRFVVAPRRQMDGCRDFICQVFLRLYLIGVVQGHGGGLGIDSSWENFQLIPRHDELGTGNNYWFFDIIDKNFVRVAGEPPNQTIRISPMPMHRGIFNNHTRIETFRVGQRSYPINYVNERPGGGAGGPPGNGGGPAGPGGPSGNGGAGGRPPQGGYGQSRQPPSDKGAGRGGSVPTGPTGGPSGMQRGNVSAGRPGNTIAKPTAPAPQLADRTRPATATKGTPVKPTTATKGTPVKPATATKGTPVKPTTATKGTPVKPATATKGTPIKSTPATKGTPAKPNQRH